MLLLYGKIFSLIFCAGLGYIAGRYLDVSQKSIASLLVYILAPIFSFYLVAHSNLPLSDIVIIPISTFICLSIGISALFVGQKVFSDSQANLLSLTLSVPNAAYFGIPLVIVFLGEHLLAVQMLIGVGVGLSVYTYGFYIMHRSIFSIRECVGKLLRLPVLYATALGFLFAALDLKIPAFLIPGFELFTGAYSVLGLMMIGIGLGRAGGFAFNGKLIGLAMFGKYICYPVLTLLILWLDTTFFQFLSKDAQFLFLLTSIMPLGINTINFAALTGEKEAEAATLVVISTAISCALIPLVGIYIR